MARLELLFFGGYQVSLGPLPVTGFESDKVRALLAYLAVDKEHHHRREKLAGLFWPDLPESRARRNLSQALYNLRSILHDRQAEVPFLILQREEVHWNPASDVWLDSSVFSTLLAVSQTHEHPSLASCPNCLDRLGQAAGLYQGDFLAGVCLNCGTIYEEWVLVTRERLRRQAMQALQNLAGSLEQNGELKQALAYTWQLLEIEPLWEPAHRQAMHLLADSGQRSAALLQYETCRRTLAEELGIGPDAETTRLYETILASNEIQLTENASEHKYASPPHHNLPSALTPLVGRSAELASLGAYLQDPGCRLVTILGMGGSGKTRLAIEAARAQLEHFSGGVYLVPLSAIRAGPRLLLAVSQSLNFQFREGVDQQSDLFDYLRSRQVLLILDSFETVLSEAAWVNDLLQTAPRLKLLVTSRTRLNLLTEQLFKLRGMQYPRRQDKSGLLLTDPDRFSAMALFQYAAQRANPGLAWDERAWQASARICALVQGMPLGLLLAASWAASYSLDEIATEVERSLDFLSVDWVDVPARQRSLRATFDYSWGLLSPAEQHSLRSLAVFSGGFTHTAARQALDVPPASLRVLQVASLIERQPDGRYILHELLRQYAVERLAADPQVEQHVREQHAIYYLGLLAGWAEGIKSNRQVAVLAEMEREASNLSAAWIWTAKQGRLGRLQAGLEGICLFYDQGFQYSEGEALCRETSTLLVESDTQDDWLVLHASISIWQALFAFFQGKQLEVPSLLNTAAERLKRCNEPVEDKKWAQSMFHLVHVYVQADLQSRLAECRACLEIFRDLDEPWWLGRVLQIAGETANRMGDFQNARVYHQESLKLRMEIGESRAVATTAQFLSYVYAWHGEAEQAYQSIQMAVDYFQAAGDRASMAEALRNLGTVMAIDGRYAEGVSLLAKALPILRDHGRRHSVLYNLRSLGLASVFLGEYDTAQSVLLETLEQARVLGDRREADAALFGLGCANLAEGKLERALDALQKCTTSHRELCYVSELGWMLGVLGLARMASGDQHAAQARIIEGLEVAVRSESILTISSCLPAAACLLAGYGRMQTAIRIYTAATKLPLVKNSVWHDQVCGPVIAAAVEKLDPELVSIARQRGQESDLHDIVRWLLDHI